MISRSQFLVLKSLTMSVASLEVIVDYIASHWFAFYQANAS